MTTQGNSMVEVSNKRLSIRVKFRIWIIKTVKRTLANMRLIQLNICMFPRTKDPEYKYKTLKKYHTPYTLQFEGKYIFIYYEIEIKISDHKCTTKSMCACMFVFEASKHY